MSVMVLNNKTHISKKESKKTKEENVSILKKLNEIEENIDCINNAFDYVTEAELIDGCIYELNSLYKKYTYYIKMCKERGIISHGQSPDKIEKR